MGTSGSVITAPNCSGGPGYRLGDECRACTCQHEGDNRLPLSRDDSEHSAVGVGAELLVKELTRRRALGRHHERRVGGQPAARSVPVTKELGAGWVDEHQRLGTEVDRTIGVGTYAGVGEAEFAGARVHEVEQLLGVLGCREVDPHPGVVTAEPSHEFRHRIGCQRGQAAHAERTSHDARDRVHGGSTGSRSRSAWRAGPTSASPAAVRRTPRPTRENNAVPSSRSSSFTARERAGCDTKTALAAAVNPPWSTTATKWRRR